MKKIFKGLIILALVIQVIMYVLPYYWADIYNDEQLNLLSWHGLSGYIDINSIIPELILIAYAIASIGLLYTKRWARTSFLLLTVANIVSTPMWGFTVSPQFDGMLGYTITLIDGALIAMMYLSSLGSEFERSA